MFHVRHGCLLLHLRLEAPRHEALVGSFHTPVVIKFTASCDMIRGKQKDGNWARVLGVLLLVLANTGSSISSSLKAELLCRLVSGASASSLTSPTGEFPGGFNLGEHLVGFALTLPLF